MENKRKQKKKEFGKAIGKRRREATKKFWFAKEKNMVKPNSLLC